MKQRLEKIVLLDISPLLPQDGDKLLDHIVTGDGTWVSHKTPETKYQSMDRQKLPTKPKTNKASSEHMETEGDHVLRSKGCPIGCFI